MRRAPLLLAWTILATLFAFSAASAQTCLTGGHNETSENLGAGGGWTTAPGSPGAASPGRSASPTGREYRCRWPARGAS